MGTQRSTYVIYGVRISDSSDYSAIEGAIGQCLSTNEEVGVFRSGEYDNDMFFLATTWCEREPGQYHLHPTAVGGVDDDTWADEFTNQLEWNKSLDRTVERLGLHVVDGPGWFCIADES